MTTPTAITLTITDVGRNAAISASGMGLDLEITHAALGRSSYEPSPSQTAMGQRVEVVSVTNIGGAGPAATIRLAADFPALTGADSAYTAHEFGLYAGHPDQGGVLFAAYSSVTPIAYRGRFNFIMAFGMTLSGVPDGSVTVQIDTNSAPFLLLLGEHERDAQAHEGLARKDGVVMQAYSAGLTAGSASAYTLAVAVPPRLERFARVKALVHATNTGIATLAVGSLLPRSIKVYGSDGLKADPAFGRMAAGMLADLEFDGQDWVLLNPIPAPVMTPLTAANVTLTPAAVGGTGSDTSPLLVPDAASPPGALNAPVVTISMSGLRPGEVVMVADLADSTNGARFVLGGISSRVANGSGVVTMPIVFSDAPASPVGAAFTMDLSINGLRIRHRRTISSTAAISQPIITAPAADATGVVQRPTVSAGAFAVTGGTSSHVSTDWQVSLSQTFDSLFVRSDADTVNKLSWLAPSLSFATTFYVRARFNGTSSSSPWSAPIKFTTQERPAVITPSMLYPTSGATGLAVAPRFTSTAFQAAGGSDTHKWSSWQISNTSDFAAVVASTTNSTADLTAWTPATSLLFSTAYFVRVRHTGNAMGDSGWSVPVQFTTGASTPIVSVPSITSPTSMAVGVKGPFVSSNFSMASGSDQHASTDWQVSTSSMFGTTVARSMGDVSAKTSWTPPALPRGTYFVRVRHNGVLGGSSPWSTPVQFTWILTSRPTITSPATGATNADTGLSISTGAFASSGSDRHVLTEWQVSLSADFASLVASVSSPTALTSWPATGLLPSTTYHVRARHTGEAGGASDWSLTVSFTTAAATGINWASAPHGAGVLRGVAFGGAKVVAVGASTVGAPGTGAIITSSDAGLSWPDKVEVISGKRIGSPYSVLYTGSVWVAVGHDIDGSSDSCAAYVSPDGVTWIEYATGPGLLRDVAWDGVRLVGVGFSADLGPVIKTSPNGQAWTNGVSLDALCGALLTIEWAPQLGLWIAGGTTTAKTEAAGAILTSPDLVTWTRATLPADVGVINKITWNGSMGVAVGMSSAASLGAGVVLTTTDGRNWVRRSVRCGAMYAAEWALSKWVIGGYSRAGTDSSGEAWTSPDGVTWTFRSTGSGRLLSLCQASAPGTPGPIIGVGFTPAGTTTAGGVYRS